MSKAKLKYIGEVLPAIKAIIGYTGNASIYMSTGLRAHIIKRHPECVRYIQDIETIVTAPDYVGKNPNEAGTSFEIVKSLDQNIQIGVKLTSEADYFYISTLHIITAAKVSKYVASGRLTALTRNRKSNKI